MSLDNKSTAFPRNASSEQPSSPKEAREWLLRIADHLETFPNAGPSFRFVAGAIKKYLQNPGANRLQQELGLVMKQSPKEGRPSVSPETVSTVTEMLVQGKTVAEISRQVKASKSTIDRIRADYNALTWKTALKKVEVGEMLPAIEASEAEERALKVSQERRTAIFEGIARAIPLKSLLPD